VTAAWSTKFNFHPVQRGVIVAGSAAVFIGSVNRLWALNKKAKQAKQAQLAKTLE